MARLVDGKAKIPDAPSHCRSGGVRQAHALVPRARAQTFSGRPPWGPGESLLCGGLAPHPLGLGTQLPRLPRPVQRTPPDPVGLGQRGPHCAAPPALRRPPAFPGPCRPPAGATRERRGLGHLHLQGPPRRREPHAASRAGGHGRLQGPGAQPRVGVSPGLHPSAGRGAGAGPGGAGRGLVAAQARAPAPAAAAARVRSTCESRVPGARSGVGGTRDSRGPGPGGAEPAVRRSGLHGPQEAPPAVLGGPC
ncbi:PREDICTED: protein G6b isoform X2 [Chinchilla lanigera]|uniref:protein G6b isoform X2 n=1 Tax=Chinchilla lanigera TaxID=34839 RepID=UPI0006974D9E|nr:PREDICTED: protein G6b isoform X2 [Chinchilla lanigera]